MSLFKGRIAAATVGTLTAAVRSSVPMVILLDADISVCLDGAFRAMIAEKPVFVHADLMKGVASDREGLLFLKEQVGFAGIVTTKPHLVKTARSVGLMCIQRTFLIDTQSLENALESIQKNPPDAVEFMPALASSAIGRIKSRIQIPLIMAGLVSCEGEIAAAFDAGADAVSMSRYDLWEKC